MLEHQCFVLSRNLAPSIFFKFPFTSFRPSTICSGSFRDLLNCFPYIWEVVNGSWHSSSMISPSCRCHVERGLSAVLQVSRSIGLIRKHWLCQAMSLWDPFLWHKKMDVKTCGFWKKLYIQFEQILDSTSIQKPSVSLVLITHEL